jgi:hypothetical protein
MVQLRLQPCPEATHPEPACWADRVVHQHSNGNFRAVLSVDHPGEMSTMYERTGSDSTVHAVWSGVSS